MYDVFQDTAGATGERDLVGDDSAPAAARNSDPNFLYLRMQLDADPAPGGTLLPGNWGVEVDLDGNPSTYEILLMIDGASGQVRLYHNTHVTLRNDPADPADSPPIATYDFATHGHIEVASGSSFGATPDYFLDMAVPWPDLAPLGLGPQTPVQVWVASSTASDALNLDFACHNGAHGSPTLSGIPAEQGPLGVGGASGGQASGAGAFGGSDGAGGAGE